MKKALIIILSLCLIFAGCSQEAAPLKVSYISASPALSASANIPSPTSEASASIVLDMGVPQYSESSPLPTINTPEPSETPTSDDVPLYQDMAIKEELNVDVNNDGTEEKITISSTDIDDPDESLTVLTVSGGSKKYKESIDGCEYVSYDIIRTQSGKVCLLIRLADHITYCSELYSFNGIKPVDLGGLGHITSVSGTDITEEGPVDALGTWHYSRIYKLKEDLSLESGEYNIIMDDKEPLHTIRKLPVEFFENGVYTKGYIDEGKDIIPVSTDGTSYLRFKLEDGSVGRIIFTKKDYVFYIDNINETDYFENLDYTDDWY